ncbi:MAG TPA: hypothetical protein IGS31_10720 [Oscillatoriales cyanobacterium M4454_W2019_049]|nr:hypothetical protein [Oscillatoriales cyanobacterium M4454_W2019_049]
MSLNNLPHLIDRDRLILQTTPLPYRKDYCHLGVIWGGLRVTDDRSPISDR